MIISVEFGGKSHNIAFSVSDKLGSATSWDNHNPPSSLWSATCFSFALPLNISLLEHVTFVQFPPSQTQLFFNMHQCFFFYPIQICGESANWIGYYRSVDDVSNIEHL